MSEGNEDIAEESEKKKVVDDDEWSWLKEQIELAKAGKVQLCMIPMKTFSSGNLLFHAQNVLKTPIEDEGVYLGYRYAAIFLQAATIECAVNDALILHAHEHFGNQAKQIAESLLSGSLPAKIRRVVPVLSHGKMYLDCSNETVRLLFQLLTVRNQLAHTVKHYRDPNAMRKARADFQENGLIPFADEDNKWTASVSLERCKQYEAAVVEFTCAIWNGPIETPPWRSTLVKEGTPEMKDGK